MQFSTATLRRCFCEVCVGHVYSPRGHIQPMSDSTFRPHLHRQTSLPWPRKWQSAARIVEKPCINQRRTPVAHGLQACMCDICQHTQIYKDPIFDHIWTCLKIFRFFGKFRVNFPKRFPFEVLQRFGTFFGLPRGPPRRAPIWATCFFQKSATKKIRFLTTFGRA